MASKKADKAKTNGGTAERPADFMGERAPVAIEPDQRAMFARHDPETGEVA
jgi:hypothetical protein